MGWADCDTDSKGRCIGYAFSATCDEPGCNVRIDRGLSFACGGMHGDNEGCEGYFCDAHKDTVYAADGNTLLADGISVCSVCARIIKADYEEFGDLI